MISTLFFYLLVAIVFLVMMSVLVTAHELGHYLAARMFGMGAEEFAIGFGKSPLVTYMRRKYRIPLSEGQAREIAMGAKESTGSGSAAVKFVQGIEGGQSNNGGALVQTPTGPALEEETAFTIRPLPLGGYVRIKGMLPEEDGSEIHIPGGFYSKPPWQRWVVLFAGPFFSVLAGILVLIPYFMISGEPHPSLKPVVGNLDKKRPAYMAGLREKDVILQVEGQPVQTFYDVIKSVRDRADLPTHLLVSRAGQQQTIVVTPEKDKAPTALLDSNLKPTDKKAIQGKIGAGPVINFTPLGFIAATKEAVSIPIEAIGGLFSVVAHPSEIKDSVGGPETMIRATADATSQSFGQVVFLAALLSISIGIFNLLPFPPLDGGQMVMALAEMLRGGKRLSIKAQSVVVVTGMAIVAAMVICVVVIDFQRYAPGSSAGSASGSAPSQAQPAPKK